MRLAIGSIFGGVCCLGLSIAPIPFQRWVIARQVGGIGAIAFFTVGYFESERKKEEQRAIDLWNFQEEQRQKALNAAIEPVLAEELIQKQQIRAKYSVADTEEEMRGNFTVLQVDRYGEDWLRSQLPQSEQILLPGLESETELETVEKIESLATKKAKLLALIEQHEGGWIGQCLKKPVLIYGDQGSGKSYFAAFLALCRYYLRGHEIVSIADPHFHQNRDECWANLVKLGIKGFGAHYDYKAVNYQIQAMFDRFSVRTLKSNPVTSIFDEVTRYSQEEATQELASKLGSRLSSDPRKANESPILIAHAKTLVALGGGGGFADAIEGNFIRIKLNSNSEQEPLWRGLVSGIKDADGETIDLKVSIAPDWIRSSWVYELFNDNGDLVETKPQIEPETSQALATANKAEFLEQARKWLKEVHDKEVEVTSETVPWDKVPEVLHEVLEVRNSNASSFTTVLPEDVRSKALTRILSLLQEVGSSSERVIELISTNPEKAVWIGVRLLDKSMTATIKEIFDCGSGGAKFKLAKEWYEKLKNQYD